MLSVVAQAGDEIDNITIKQDPATIGSLFQYEMSLKEVRISNMK
jgi:hypothetical protein